MLEPSRPVHPDEREPARARRSTLRSFRSG